MRIALYTNSVSPHQLPLAREIVSLVGANNYRYIYNAVLSVERVKLGWEECKEPWIIFKGNNLAETARWLEDADLLISTVRALDVFERRSLRGLKTCYMSERWLKPPLGILRMLHPGYYRMAKRMVRLINCSESFHYLPIGVWAQSDMARLGARNDKMIPWGYFVSPGLRTNACDHKGMDLENGQVRVLWVGRMVALKNADVLIKAIRRLDPERFKLTLVGAGPCEGKLRHLASGMQNIDFKPTVPVSEVRALMRKHDVFVFPSNGFEGWGAVVSEAMEEGLIVLGSNQAGAPATLLPPTHRFDCRDIDRLATLLRQIAEGSLRRISIGRWTAHNAAERLVSLI